MKHTFQISLITIGILLLFFTYSIHGLWNEHYNDIDNNTSDMDGIADVGIETNFINCQDIIPDMDYMTIQEIDTGTGAVDYKTASTGNTDIYLPSDVGTENNYAYCQETAPDTDIMTLIEYNNGWDSGSENLKAVNGFDSTYTSWSISGSTPYLESIGNGYIYTSTRNINEGWFAYTDSTAPNSATCTVTLGFYCYQATGGDDTFEIYADWTGGSGTTQGSITPPVTSYGYKEKSLSSTITGLQLDSLRIYVISRRTGGTMSTIYIDYSYFNVTWTGNPDYELNQEYQFTGLHFSETHEELCFYVTTIAGETLKVDYYNSGWVNLGSITASGWFNFTATNLISSNYNIQVYDENQSGEASGHTWSIDCLFIHTWNETIVTYQLDFEYQFTTSYYSNVNEKICIYVQSITNLETFNVNYYTGSIWSNIGSLTSTGWNNMTATGLTSSTYTLQIKDNGGDVSQTIFEIDAILLYTYDDTGNPDPPNNFIVSKVLSSDTDLYLTWNKGTYGEYTRIQYKEGTYPTTINDGINCYNDTGTEKTVTGLTGGVTYYFSAWSFNVTYSVYSVTYVYDENSPYVRPSAPTDFSGGFISTSRIILVWTKGSGAVYTRIQFKNDNYPSTISDGTNTYNDTGSMDDNTGLDDELDYYYSAWSYDDTSNLWSNTYATVLISYGGGGEKYTITLIENIVGASGTHEYADNGTGYTVWANYTGTGECTGMVWVNYTDENLTFNVSINKTDDSNTSSYLINNTNWLKISGFSFDAPTFLFIYLFTLLFFIYNEKTNNLFVKSYSHMIFIMFTLVLLLGIEAGEFITDFGFTDIERILLTPFILVFIILLWVFLPNKNK